MPPIKLYPHLCSVELCDRAGFCLSTIALESVWPVYHHHAVFVAFAAIYIFLRSPFCLFCLFCMMYTVQLHSKSVHLVVGVVWTCSSDESLIMVRVFFLGAIHNVMVGVLQQIVQCTRESWSL